MAQRDDIGRTSPHALRLRLFDRTVHPEWFSFVVLRRTTYAGDTIVAGMLRGGHLFHWQRERIQLTEVVSVDQVLPTQGLHQDFSLSDGRRAKQQLKQNLKYEFSCQIEVMTQDVYIQVHEELIHDGSKRGMLHYFPKQTQRGLCPLSYMTVETVPAGLVVCSFHSFPDDLTVLKTQSLLDFALMSTAEPNGFPQQRASDSTAD